MLRSLKASYKSRRWSQGRNPFYSSLSQACHSWGSLEAVNVLICLLPPLFRLFALNPVSITAFHGMSLRNGLLLGLIAAVSAQSPGSPFDYVAETRALKAELETYKPYSKPNQKIKEFITPGDSYTAGIGCNGIKDAMAWDAYRGKKSYPMQMKDDVDNWEKINGDREPPRLTFPAFTGDTSRELVQEQLNQGPYKDNNWNFERAIPFGKPQIAIMSIGGNDAGLGK